MCIVFYHNIFVLQVMMIFLLLYSSLISLKRHKRWFHFLVIFRIHFRRTVALFVWLHKSQLNQWLSLWFYHLNPYFQIWRENGGKKCGFSKKKIQFWLWTTFLVKIPNVRVEKKSEKAWKQQNYNWLNLVEKHWKKNLLKGKAKKSEKEREKNSHIFLPF